MQRQNGSACRREYRVEGHGRRDRRNFGRKGADMLRDAGADDGGDLAARTRNTRCLLTTSSPPRKLRRTWHRYDGVRYGPPGRAAGKATVLSHMYKNAPAPRASGPEVQRRRIMIRHLRAQRRLLRRLLQEGAAGPDPDQARLRDRLRRRGRRDPDPGHAVGGLRHRRHGRCGPDQDVPSTTSSQ